MFMDDRRKESPSKDPLWFRDQVVSREEIDSEVKEESGGWQAQCEANEPSQMGSEYIWRNSEGLLSPFILPWDMFQVILKLKMILL